MSIKGQHLFLFGAILPKIFRILGVLNAHLSPVTTLESNCDWASSRARGLRLLRV